MLKVVEFLPRLVFWESRALSKCKYESKSILGFFWTDCAPCDIVVVKTSGLDLFAYDYVSKSLILVETRKLNATWYIYKHEIGRAHV